MPDNKTRRPEQSATIATHAAKSPGGFMPNDDGSARPATSLGFADTQARTRPDFDAVMGLEKPPRPEPASESEFVAVRREIYRKGVSLRRAFGRIGPGSRLRTERFREILGGLQLGVPPESVDRIVASLDGDKTGSIDLSRFIDALNIKVQPRSPQAELLRGAPRNSLSQEIWPRPPTASTGARRPRRPGTARSRSTVPASPLVVQVVPAVAVGASRRIAVTTWRARRSTRQARWHAQHARTCSGCAPGSRSDSDPRGGALHSTWAAAGRLALDSYA